MKSMLTDILKAQDRQKYLPCAFQKQKLPDNRPYNSKSQVVVDDEKSNWVIVESVENDFENSFVGFFTTAQIDESLQHLPNHYTDGKSLEDYLNQLFQQLRQEQKQEQGQFLGENEQSKQFLTPEFYQSVDKKFYYYGKTKEKDRRTQQRQQNGLSTMDGEGILMTADRQYIMGVWSDGALRDGRIIFPNKDRYDGQIRNLKPHGKGTRFYEKNQTYYKGDFKFGLRNGYGIERYQSNEEMVCQGQWTNDAYIQS